MLDQVDEIRACIQHKCYRSGGIFYILYQTRQVSELNKVILVSHLGDRDPGEVQQTSIYEYPNIFYFCLSFLCIHF